MSEYKQTMKNIPVTSISGQIAKEWKELSSFERSQWEHRAKEDKKRYEAEKALYTGPWQVPATKRSKKDPRAPKRPASAFLFYCQIQRPVLKRKHPEMKNTDISKLLGQNWNTEPRHVRRPHIDREAREREVYKTRVAAWRKERDFEEKQSRAQRAAIAKQYMERIDEATSDPSHGAGHAAPVVQHPGSTAYHHEHRHHSHPVHLSTSAVSPEPFAPPIPQRGPGEEQTFDPPAMVKSELNATRFGIASEPLGPQLDKIFEPESGFLSSSFVYTGSEVVSTGPFESIEADIFDECSFDAEGDILAARGYPNP